VPLENVALVVRPVFDDVTKVLAKKIAPVFMKVATDRLYTVWDLYDKDAVRETFEWSILVRDPLIVAGFSHGGPEIMQGDDGITAFLYTGNTITLKDRIVYLCGCEAGQRLAPAAVEIGARAVLAYDDVIYIAVDPETMEPAEGFKQVFAEKPARLFEGLTVHQVYQEVIAEYDKWIQYWESKGEGYPQILADAFRNNRDHFKLYGAGVSRIVASPWVLIGITNVITYVYIALYAILNVIRLYHYFKE
jgi:hypothetical protein